MISRLVSAFKALFRRDAPLDAPSEKDAAQEQLTPEEFQRALDVAYDSFREACEAGVVPTWEVFNSWGQATRNVWKRAYHDVWEGREALKIVMLMDETTGSKTFTENAALRVVPEQQQDTLLQHRARRQAMAQVIAEATRSAAGVSE